jgi:hypothetical protein
MPPKPIFPITIKSMFSLLENLIMFSAIELLIPAARISVLIGISCAVFFKKALCHLATPCILYTPKVYLFFLLSVDLLLKEIFIYIVTLFNFYSLIAFTTRLVIFLSSFPSISVYGFSSCTSTLVNPASLMASI